MNARKLSILRAMFPEKRRAAALSARWAAASQRDPRLAEDMIELGGVRSGQPDTYQDGIAVGPIDPIRMAKLEGRRELAVEMLTLMGVTPHDLKQLSEDE